MRSPENVAPKPEANYTVSQASHSGLNVMTWNGKKGTAMKFVEAIKHRNTATNAWTLGTAKQSRRRASSELSQTKAD